MQTCQAFGFKLSLSIWVTAFNFIRQILESQIQKRNVDSSRLVNRCASSANNNLQIKQMFAQNVLTVYNRL